MLQRLSIVFPVVAVVILGVVQPSEVHAQEARVVTEVDRTRVEIGEDVELTVQASGRYEELEVPTVDGFDVVGQRFKQVNRNVSRTYVLRSRGPGTFTIGPARVKSGGRVIATSAPISIVVAAPVVAAPVNAATAQDLAAHEQEAVFVRWATPRARYFVGEPFTMTLELWLAGALTTRQAELIKAAAFEGLLVEELPRTDEATAEKRVIGKTAFSVHPLTTVLATPLKTGRVLVDATTVRLAVAEDDWSLAARSLTRSSPAYWLDVDEVPTQGRPEGFSSTHVGKFELKVTLRDERSQDVRQARTGQRLVLRAEVSGSGNLQGLGAPIVAHDAGWEVSLLPGNSEDRVVRDARGMRGTRVFQWLAVPREPGQRDAPVVRLPFFEPAGARFVTLTSALAPLEVTGASAAASQTLDASILGEDVGPIFTDATLDSGAPQELGTNLVYWLGLGCVALAFVGVEFRSRRRRAERRSPGLRVSRDASANAHKRLKAAERTVKDGLTGDVYALLSRVLTAFLEERVNIPAAGLTHDQLRGAMARVGYQPELVEAVVAELEHCDFGRFAPGQSDLQRIRAMFNRVSELLSRLEAVDVRRLP